MNFLCLSNGGVATADNTEHGIRWSCGGFIENSKEWKLKLNPTVTECEKTNNPKETQFSPRG
jgi:hypothetical protein